MCWNLTYTIGLFLSNFCSILCCEGNHVSRDFNDQFNEKNTLNDNRFNDMIKERPYLRYNVYSDNHV